VPTVAESGVPGYEYSTWYGLLAPARTPQAIVNRLNRTATSVLSVPDYRQRLLAQGMDPVPSTAAQFAAYLKTETSKWTKVVRAANIPLQ
jgi:tripartite-type tricarboxylate transporter receptor subunit TctC